MSRLENGARNLKASEAATTVIESGDPADVGGRRAH